jgi:hypothetical protein
VTSRTHNARVYAIASITLRMLLSLGLGVVYGSVLLAFDDRVICDGQPLHEHPRHLHAFHTSLSRKGLGRT